MRYGVISPCPHTIQGWLLATEQHASNILIIYQYALHVTKWYRDFALSFFDMHCRLVDKLAAAISSKILLISVLFNSKNEPWYLANSCDNSTNQNKILLNLVYQSLFTVLSRAIFCIRSAALISFLHSDSNSLLPRTRLRPLSIANSSNLTMWIIICWI